MAARWGFDDRDEVTSFLEELRERGYIYTDTGGGDEETDGISAQLTPLGVSISEKICP
jgi:hypothetical protein